MKDRRVALLSGASRGIGAAVADRLHSAGWQLSLGLRDPDALSDRYPGTQRVRHDALAGDEAAWVQTAHAEYGRVDAVIACAGIMEPASVIEIEDEGLDCMWEVNVKSPRRLVRAAWPHLSASGSGRVILLASLSGKRVKSSSSGSYAMTKHAVVALGHGIRQAGWEDGIRATSICPGFVDTDMARAITDHPAEQMTRPDDVAKLVELALEMPNSAVIAELAVNCLLEEQY